MNKLEFDKKLLKKFPNEKYCVLHYGENSHANSVIKCLECGRRIIVNTGELFRARRKHICSKCYYKRVDTQNNEELVLKSLSEEDCSFVEFFMQERQGVRHNMVRYTCNKCHRNNVREVANFLRNKTICNYCAGNIKDTECFFTQMQEKFGNSFSLLSEYNSAKTDIRIRCNRCGFIRDLKPNTFLLSGFCPKCGDKTSKGERTISQFLIQHNIAFEQQKYFSEWKIGIHYFDFYIPDFNLVLEYHGAQHYVFNKFFHRDENDFLSRKKKDELKKETALAKGYNYAVISYQSFSNLENILTNLFNSTTIPKGSRGKLLEIETTQ